MKSKQPKVIDRTIAIGMQSVTATDILVINGKKVKFEIKSDTYRSQSHATSMLWTGDRWNSVHSIQPSLMATEIGLIHKPNGANAADFAKDFTELERVTLAILTEPKTK